MVETNAPELPASGSRLRPEVLERRNEPRFAAGRVGFRSTQIRASLVDLSRDGLAIESLDQPAIGDSLSFFLDLGRTRVEADGVVRWCRLRRTYRTPEGDVVPVYRAGLRLEEGGPSGVDSIARVARLDSSGGHV